MVLFRAFLVVSCLAAALAHSHSHESHDHDHGHGGAEKHDHDHGHGASASSAASASSGPSGGRYVWLEAFVGTTIITAGGNMVILLFMNKPLSGDNLNVMVSFAIGGLLGDVFLHLLPHASAHGGHGGHDHGHHDHGHDHDHGGGGGHEGHSHDLSSMSSGLFVLLGIITFFVIEKWMHNNMGHGGAHGHGHSHGHGQGGKKEKVEDAEQEDREEEGGGAGDREGRLRKRGKAGAVSKSPAPTKSGAVAATTTTTAAAAAAAAANSGDSGSWLSRFKGAKPGAYLNLIADTVHNFTDGLAIGAAFLTSQRLGISTTLAVFFHEVPHEVGDFAVLVQQGFSKRDAFAAQFVSALGAFLGCFVALVAAGDSPVWVLSFTAGGFIYIACVNIFPELVQAKCSLGQALKEVGAICVGISFMIVIAYFE